MILETFINKDGLNVTMSIGKEDYVTSRAGLVIYHDGYIDLDGFYDAVKDWYDRRKYEFTERQHQVKNKQHGAEIVYVFQGIREVNNFFKFHIYCNVLITRARPVKEGYHARFQANIPTYLELDWQNHWQKTPLRKFLFYIYVNYVIKNKIQREYEGKLYREMLSLIHTIKTTLKVHD